MLVRLHKLLTFSRPYLADQRPTNIKLNCLANYIFLKDKIQLGLQLFTSIHMTVLWHQTISFIMK